MRLLYWLMTAHFMAGGLGMLLINMKLKVEERRSNWLKYSIYILIYGIVLTSILVNKNIFLGVCMGILSASFLELLRLGKQPCKFKARDQVMGLSMLVFSVLAFLFSAFILLPETILVFVYSLVVIFDGAGQLFGRLAGKRKIIPAVSPNKTLEGLLGGTVSAVLTAGVLHSLVEFSVMKALMVGLLVCAAAFTGDLAASAYKRAFYAKDFGNLLPGQGGMLDRFDSFLAGGAMAGLLFLSGLITAGHCDSNIAAYLGFSMLYIGILLAGEIIHLRFSIRTEYCRAFTHVLAGMASLTVGYVFTEPWYVVVLCLQSAIFIYLTKKMGYFDAHHRVERVTNGSSWFFAGIAGAYLISRWQHDVVLFILPVAILTVSDPVAAIIGIKRKSGFWPVCAPGGKSVKSYAGSLGFFASSLLILATGFTLFYNVPLPERIGVSFALAGLATIVEAFSYKGTDNMTVPLITAVVLACWTG